jgi:hypothetical protein
MIHAPERRLFSSSSINKLDGALEVFECALLFRPHY